MARHLDQLFDRFTRQSRGEGTGLGFDPNRAEGDVLLDLPLDQIEPDPDQPRQDLGDLSELKDSIEEFGLIQPIIVSRGKAPDDPFRIVAGERRYTAVKELGLRVIPAVVRSQEEHHRLALQLLENLVRKDLTPFESAASYQLLMQEFGYDQERLAKYLRLSPVTISETLALNRLPEKIRKAALRTSEPVSRSLLLEIARVPDEADQLALWERVREGKMTVREARRGRTPRKASPSVPQAPAPKGTTWTTEAEGATITIEFPGAGATRADRIRVLRAALQQEDADGPQAW